MNVTLFVVVIKPFQVIQALKNKEIIVPVEVVIVCFCIKSLYNYEQNKKYMLISEAYVCLLVAQSSLHFTLYAQLPCNVW